MLLKKGNLELDHYVGMYITSFKVLGLNTNILYLFANVITEHSRICIQRKTCGEAQSLPLLSSWVLVQGGANQ